MTDLLIEDNNSLLLAKKRIRYAAMIIDYMLLIGIDLIILNFFWERHSIENGVKFYLTGWPALLPILAWFIIFPLLEGYKGQTLGKMLLKIKVLKQDYTKATLG